MMDIKDILIRALKTFVQAFIPVLLASLKVCDITDESAIKGILVSALLSAVAAGISAVWNSISGLITTSGKDTDEPTETTEE